MKRKNFIEVRNVKLRTKKKHIIYKTFTNLGL